MLIIMVLKHKEVHMKKHYKNNKSFQNATPFRNYFSVNSEPDKKQFMRFVTTDQTSQGVTTELFMFLCNYICFLSCTKFEYEWILQNRIEL